MVVKPEYTFTRDLIDNNRVNPQHHLWIQLFGYHVHPAIPLLGRAAENAKPLRIADIGTGTDIWMTSLGEQIPDSVRFDGLDVSFDAAPPLQWLPSNIVLKKWNVREPPPEELVGAYELVHIRNFAYVLQDAEVPNVLAHLVALIKPGGYLQWGEPDVASFRVERTDPKNKVDTFMDLLKVSQGQDERLAPAWISKLPETFERSGLVNVEADVEDAPPHPALAMHECNLVIHGLVARQTQDTGVAEAIAQLMPEVERETRDGSCWAFTRWTVIGKKET
ncbi:hypothetical protein K458DRAFT_286569 [Lentithecium fluviatile CBS 122367]|uniref:Methyltransferase domain-containing protein n=1 Tax=Lentithecium fluviatile CBS 122367 TaxID=1168545 RepID=A0A6G1JNM1_9PLEO|nr:hypothetical protein K458DRAFT_286569 [Lentithecium fluviatile CBS 122367]